MRASALPVLPGCRAASVHQGVLLTLCLCGCACWGLARVSAPPPAVYCQQVVSAFATHETLVDSSVEQLEIVFNQVARPIITSAQANATYERATKHATAGAKPKPKDTGNLIVGTRQLALFRTLNKLGDDNILDLVELEDAMSDADQELVTFVNELGIDLKLTDDTAGWSRSYGHDRARGCRATSRRDTLALVVVELLAKDVATFSRDH